MVFFDIISDDGDTKMTTTLCWPRCTMVPGAAAGAHFWPKICFFLRYAYITPIFWCQTDLTQWGHISPISWANSGYIRFFGRQSFSRSAGRYWPQLAKVTIDKVKNVFFGRKSFFLKLSLKLIPFLWKAMVRVKMFHFVWFFVHFDKLIRRPPGPLWGVPPFSVNFFPLGFREPTVRGGGGGAQGARGRAN